MNESVSEICVMVWQPSAKHYGTSLTFAGAMAHVLSILIDAQEEGVTLARHHRIFTSTILMLQRNFEVEVVATTEDWRTDATGARFTLRSEVHEFHRKHDADSCFEGRYWPDDRRQTRIDAPSSRRFWRGRD